MSENDFEHLEQVEPWQRFRLASTQIDEHRAAMSRLADIRAGALLELRQSGLSVIEIAEALGLTRQRVNTLVKDAWQKGSNFHVEPTANGWQVRRADEKSPMKTFRSKEEALHWVRPVLQAEGRGELVVHFENGLIQSKNSYGPHLS